MRKPGFLKPCDGYQAFALTEEGTSPKDIPKLKVVHLRCEMAQGHEGSHITTTPDGKPYQFPNF